VIERELSLPLLRQLTPRYTDLHWETRRLLVHVLHVIPLRGSFFFLFFFYFYFLFFLVLVLVLVFRAFRCA
jgi:hypothetical protein